MLNFQTEDSTRIHAAIDSWELWSCPLIQRPNVVRKIQGGLTNSSYLLEGDGAHYVLRLNHPNSEKLGINRSHELKILQSLSGKNLAPELVYWCKFNTFSVFRFIDGRTWTDRDFSCSYQVKKLYEALEQIRVVQADIPQFDYIQYVSDYWRIFSKTRPHEARKHVKDWLTFKRKLILFDRMRGSRVLTHHDLVPGNIIERDGHVYLIDWEYAGLGYCEFDYVFISQTAASQKKKKKVGVVKERACKELQKELIAWLSLIWFYIR